MASQNPPAFRFDTRDYPRHAAFETWREVISVTHDVEPGDDAPSGFHVACAFWSLGPQVVSSGRFASQSFVRDAARIRRDQIDDYGLFVQGDGYRFTRAAAGDALLRRGDIQMCDMTKTEESFASAGSSGSLFLPRDLVDDVVPDFGRFNGLVLRDGAARLLAEHILALGQHLADVPAAAIPGLARATLNLALGTLSGLASGVFDASDASTDYEPSLRRQVERHIAARLGDPGLDVDAICDAFGISRATLYRLFESRGGVATYVKRRRLARIRAILVAGDDPRPLAKIAGEYGFLSGSHFSREFRREFGCAPSEARARRTTSASAERAPATGLDKVFRLLHP